MKLTHIVGLTLALTVIALGATLAGHERKEVAGLEVVFGAEPEPAINGDKQFLRWRFLNDKQPFGDVRFSQKATSLEFSSPHERGQSAGASPRPGWRRAQDNRTESLVSEIHPPNPGPSTRAVQSRTDSI